MNPGPNGAQAFNDAAMAWPVQHADANLCWLNALGFRQSDNVFSRCAINVDNARWQAGANGDFVHIGIWGIQKPAFGRDGQNG